MQYQHWVQMHALHLIIVNVECIMNLMKFDEYMNISDNTSLKGADCF